MNHSSSDGNKFFRFIVIVLLLAILFVLIGIEAGLRGRIFILPSPVSQTAKAQSNQDDVGQNEDKIVTQDEPNTTQDPNSPAIDNTPDEQPPSVTVAQTAPQPVRRAQQEITTVAGEQDVQEPPKSEIGGLKEANELFKEENLGQNPEPPEDGPNLLIAGGLTALVIGCIVMAVILLKKKKIEDQNHSA